MINVPIDCKSAMLITDRKTRKYFTGVDVAEGYVVITSSTISCYTDARYFSAAKVKLQSVNVAAVLFEGLDKLSQDLKADKIKKLYVDFTKETVSDYNSYKELGFKVVDCSGMIKSLRAVKTQAQIEYVKKACEIAERAYHTAIKEIKKGITETALKDRLESLMFSFGADGLSFETIVAFGENSAVPHHETGETKLEDNSVILVDMGCTVNGYCSDLTRTAFFGTPSEKFKNYYQAVLDANVRAEQNISSGISGKTADALARDYLKKNGLDKYFTHSLGHGIGLDVHEYPTLSPKREDELKDGMVFSVEPGVYLDGEFGIRIEDTVMLENGKVKRLFTDDKNLIIL